MGNILIRLGVILFYLGREMVRFEVGGFVVNEGVEHLVSLGKPRDPSPNPSFFLVGLGINLISPKPRLFIVSTMPFLFLVTSH